MATTSSGPQPQPQPQPQSRPRRPRSRLIVWLIHRLGGTVEEPPPPTTDKSGTDQEIAHSPQAPPGPFNQPATDRLIGMRDRLAKEDNPGALMRWIDGELLLALAEQNVRPVRDDGPVDERRHRVVEARPTTETSLDEHIAETLEPGYLSESRLLRPQLVVAWVIGRR